MSGLQPAPFHHDVADAPAGIRAHWTTTDDGLRIRIAHIRPDDARGTVLLFPGRTEYCEKYGPAADRFAAEKLATLIVDWRGQGLADRILDDRLGGHVLLFSDYQRDVAAMLRAADDLELPRPFFLLAHSMGGAIGLRALHGGLPVASSAFSSPMWGIFIAPGLRPIAWSLSWAAERAGLDHHYAPGTSKNSYPNTVAFDLNLLTHDRDMFNWMAHQTERHPDLALGGPSMRWLGEALRECRRLMRMPAPDSPTLAVVGSEEKIVDVKAIAVRLADWPDARLVTVEGGRHETLMETPQRRDDAYRAILEHYRAHH